MVAFFLVAFLAAAFFGAAFLAAAFLGADLGSLREGAINARGSQELIETFAASTLASWDRGEGITQFWYYSDQLDNLGRWTQQLWAESLSKKVNRGGVKAPQASCPLVARGPADQHSMLQQVMEGPRDKWIWFIEPPFIPELSPGKISKELELPFVEISFAEILQAQIKAS